jgi:intein/homing endonuclease
MVELGRVYLTFITNYSYSSFTFLIKGVRTMPGKKGATHAILTKIVYDSILTDAKRCNQCGEVKPLQLFYKAPAGIGKRRPRCIACMSPTGRTLTKLIDIEVDGVKVPAKKCKSCKTPQPLSNFHKGKGTGDRVSFCKKCMTLKNAEIAAANALDRKKIKHIERIEVTDGEKEIIYWNMLEGSPKPIRKRPSEMKGYYHLTTREGYELVTPSVFHIKTIPKQSQKKQYVEYVPLKNVKAGDKIGLANFRELMPWSGNGNFEQGWLLGELLGDGGLAGEHNYAYVRFWGSSKQELAELAVSRIKEHLGARCDLAGSKFDKHDRISVQSSRLTELAECFGLNNSKYITYQIEVASHEFYCGLIRGFFDSDGSVQGNQQKGVSVRLHQSNLETIKKVQNMLLRLGIVSTIYKNRRPAGYRSMPDGNGGYKDYFCEATHDLVISSDNIVRFRDLIGFDEPEKMKKLNELISNFKRTPNRERFVAIIEQVIYIEEPFMFELDECEKFLELNGILLLNPKY